MREGRIPRAIGLLLALAVVGMAVRFYAIRAREARWETQRVATLAILNQRTDDIQFEKAALTDVLDFIRDTYGVPLRVDWNALSQTGVGPQAPVSARLRQVRIDKLLRHILNETGSGNAPLAHDIADDGCIFITTERNLLSAVETRRYDIRDFLGLVPDDSTLIGAIRDLIMNIGVAFSSNGTFTGPNDWHLMFSLPLWLISATALAPLGITALVHRRHALRAGCCSKCGYDLRATPLRCPECGAVAETTTVQS